MTVAYNGLAARAGLEALKQGGNAIDAVMTGALLAFLTSFDEVVIALFISGGENSTLTRSMFNSLRDQIDPTITAISTLMILVSTGLMAAAQVLGRPRHD